LNEVFDALPACRVQRSPMQNKLSLVTALIKPAVLSHRRNEKGRPSRAASLSAKGQFRLARNLNS
jgi:hypothetical protein